MEEWRHKHQSTFQRASEVKIVATFRPKRAQISINMKHSELGAKPLKSHPRTWVRSLHLAFSNKAATNSAVTNGLRCALSVSLPFTSYRNISLVGGKFSIRQSSFGIDGTERNINTCLCFPCLPILGDNRQEQREHIFNI